MPATSMGSSLDGRVVGLETRQLEQVFDDACHAIGLAPHLRDRARPARPARVGAEGLEITGDHGERRAQFVRGIGDEVLAHLLETHLARHVAQHQQALILAIRNELEGHVAFDVRVDAHDDGQRILPAAQVLHEIRMAHQVVDAQAQVGAPREVEQLTRLAIEPDDFALRIEHDHAVGHGRGGAPQLAEQPRQPLLVKSLAPMQAHHLRHHVAPQAHGIRRVGDAAMLQPELQLAQLPEIPGEVQRERAADAEPRRNPRASPPSRPAPTPRRRAARRRRRPWCRSS